MEHTDRDAGSSTAEHTDRDVGSSCWRSTWAERAVSIGKGIGVGRGKGIKYKGGVVG